MNCPNKHTLIMSADTCPSCEASRLLEANRILRNALTGMRASNDSVTFTSKWAEEVLARAKSKESGGG